MRRIWAFLTLLFTSLLLTAPIQAQAIQVSLTTTAVPASTPVTVAVTAGDLTGRGIIAFDFDLLFDPAVLQIQATPIDQSGTLSSAMTVTPNVTTGRIRVSGFGTVALTGSGTLLKLNFNAIGSAGSGSNLIWQKFQFNEGTPQTTTVNGRIDLISASDISISPSNQTILLTRDATFTVTINPVQAGATTITLASSNPALVAVPASISIPAGVATGNFKALGSAPGGPVTITAGLPSGLGGKTATATANVIRIVACFSAANYWGEPLAIESIVAMFGVDMATTSMGAPGVPLPTILGGTKVEVRDANGTTRLAPLFYVSPGQINYQIPEGTVPGSVTITVTSGNGTVSIGSMAVSTVAPGVFTADSSGNGVAAAWAYRYKADGSVIPTLAFTFDTVLQKYVSVPIDLGAESDVTYLLLFGTGIRYRSSLSNTIIKLGGTDAQVDYAGPQGDYVGLDQMNILVPRSLIGRGEVDVVLTVDNKPANLVRLNFK